MAAQQSTTNCITLKGSAQIIAEYLKYGINSILFQRGIYPAETFESTQKYGLTILMSKDPKIEDFLKNVLKQAEEWIANEMVQKIAMTITNAHTKEVLECWDFKIQSDKCNNENSNATANAASLEQQTSSKDLKRIQNEIRDVMRQISATVTYLPLLDCICTFDVMIYTNKECAVPVEWNESEGVFIQNAQSVQLRTFSTGLQKVETVVNYKLNT